MGTSSTTTTTRTTTRVDIYWDFSHPKYVFNGPEPQGGYFVGIVCNDEMVLLLGDKSKEAYKRTRARPPVNDATLLSRKEHIFGKKSFCTKGRLDDTDKTYDIVIEYGLSEEEEEELIFVEEAGQMVGEAIVSTSRSSFRNPAGRPSCRAIWST